MKMPPGPTVEERRQGEEQSCGVRRVMIWGDVPVEPVGNTGWI